MTTTSTSREPGAVDGRRVRLGGLVVDLDGYVATFAGRRLSLTASQLEVLSCLVENHSRVVSRRELALAAGVSGNRSVDALLCTLRKEFGFDFLRNVRNRGWMIVPGALDI